MRSSVVLCGALALLVACCFGCAEQDAGLVTDMHEDFDHEHQHQHSDQDDHEHEHADGFNGSHSHEHTHSHRHDADALYGGQLASIGHTHHADGATHFHAEVMPLEENTIRLHILTDAEDGGLKACPVEAKELVALISIVGKELSTKQSTLVAVGSDSPASEFAVEIPEDIAGADQYSVVIPKIELGGDRQNFSFRVRRPAGDEVPVEVSEGSEQSDG